MSVTIAGLIVMVLAKLCAMLGVSVSIDALHMTANTLVEIIGGVVIWYGRHRIGDINAVGIRK